MPEAFRRQDLDISETRLGTAFEAISQFSGATRAQRMLMTLWAAHTFTFRAFPASPRIDFCADGPGCGKTVNMQVVTDLSESPVVVGYSSQASVYSYLDEHPDTTLGLDETDKIFGTTGRKTSRAILAAIINDGYTSRGKVMVMRNGKSVLMPVYSPIALAGIGRLPDDTLDRCLVIYLEKSAPPMTYVPELYADDLRLIADAMAQWLTLKESQEALKAAPQLADVPGSPRFRLIMAPLAAIAQLAGCLDQFKTAITEIQTGISENPPASLAELLISDLASAWPAELPVLRACELITLLHGHPSHRWDKLSTSRIGEIALAGMFREAEIESQVRDGVRGYLRADVLGEQQTTDNRYDDEFTDLPACTT